MDAWIGRSVSPSFAHHCPTRASVEVNDFLWHLINNSSSSSDIAVSWSFHWRLAKGSSVARCSTPIFTRHLSQVVARWNYTLRTKGTAANASFLVTVSRIFDLDCVLTVVHFRISCMVCSPPRYLIPESEQTQSIRSSGSSLPSRTSHDKVQGPPQQNRTEAITPCGTAQGPPGLSTIGNTQTAMGCLQACKDDCESASWGRCGR